VKKLIAIVSAAVVLIAGAVVWASRHAGSTTIGQSVNAAIDNLQAVAVRLLELPNFILLLWVAILGTGLAILLARFATTSRRVTYLRVGLIAAGLAILVGLALEADRKIARLQREVDKLRAQVLDQQMGASESPTPEKGGASAGVSGAARSAVGAGSSGRTVTTPVRTGVTPKRDVPLFDADEVSRTLTARFGALNFHPVIYDKATDVVKVNFNNLPAVAYMAVIDLGTSGLELKLGGSLTTKTLTTEFARNNQCSIAINGEAGASPRMNSGLGTWTGNFISKGKVLLKEQAGNRRPFLAFDKRNRASFTPMAAISRALPAEPYNVIWGRLDAIIDGTLQTENERDRQPRTGMGIDQDGTRLFLMVVDGRQQRYSVGFTRGEVGLFMQAFGAFNGMLCDEGGSSCIYMGKYGGIINSPSDGDERETYTHFGVSLH
jgi:hypothetical protein